MKRHVSLLTVWAIGLASMLAGLAPVSASGQTPALAAAVPTPGGFTSLVPSRLVDTRTGLGAPKAAVAPGGTVHLTVAGVGGVPNSGVSAVVLNVTVTAPTRAGFITVYGDGTTRPATSNLNFVAGQSVPNLVIAQVGAGGNVALYNGSAGTVHLVADVSGYYLAGPPTVPGTFGSLVPSRLVDTRTGLGAPKAAVAPGGTVHLTVAGVGGVPNSGVSAVVLNVTVTAPTRAGFITVYGDGTTRPATSNLNFVAGQSVPNLVIAQVGAGGNVALYNGSAGTVHLVADVSGYYLAGPPTVPGTFGSLVPSRLVDTRTGLGAPKAAVAPGGTVHLTVAGVGGVPNSGVSAVVLNVTVTAPTRAGFITVYGDGTTRPATSNLNFVAGQSVPNLVIAQVGAGGNVALYNGSAGTVHLVADVSGYYLAGPPTVPGTFGSLVPSRLVDTRTGLGAPKAAVAPGGTVHLTVAGVGGVPNSGVSAVVLNVTVTAPTRAGFITVYGDGTTRPATSNLNFVAGQSVPNLVIAQVGAGGNVALYNGSAGTVHLVADVSGWFTNTNAVPGQVTNVTATPNSTSIALSWTNPTAASFTGVMIRRAQGSTPPATPTAGTLVTDVATPAMSVTDTGLLSGTPYSYALFAHDATPGY